MAAVVPIAKPERRLAWGLLVPLVALTGLGWGWSLHLASEGHHGLELPARVLMWTTMMVGMMVPPEVPTLLGLAGAGGAGRWRALREALGLLGGYLGVWMLASAVMAVLDARLGAWGLMTHEMTSRSVPLDVGILVTAGILQLSPWKSACLERCRAIPAELRAGFGAPLRSGIGHGLASVSSCGLLMLVLLVVGAMNWVAMVLLTAFLVAERVLPASAASRLGRFAGVGLLGWGTWLALTGVAR
jgi:predicted metal-binding membrane protein